MAKRIVTDIVASNRVRLLNLSKKSGENYNAVLLRFFQERFLVRLGISPYSKHFVLKGGLLLLTQQVSPFRPTMDIDMLGVAISNDQQHLKKVIKEIIDLKLNDGVIFDANSITFSNIKEDAEYQGLRFIFGVSMGKINTRMQIDIAFGDEVPFTFIKSTLPLMLSGFSAPQILLYPLESVIAEKYQAIVYLGLSTSRMKDFYDILFICQNNTFVLKRLKKAIEATFLRRETDLAKRLFVYEQKYILEKEKLWQLFLKKINCNKRFDFSEVTGNIKKFIEPVITAGKSEEDLVWDALSWQWKTK